MICFIENLQKKSNKTKKCDLPLFNNLGNDTYHGSVEVKEWKRKTKAQAMIML